MKQEIKDGIMETLDVCIEIGHEDEFSRNLTLLLFDEIMDVAGDK